MPSDQTIRCWGMRSIDRADIAAIEVAIREALRQVRENDRIGKTTVCLAVRTASMRWSSS